MEQSYRYTRAQIGVPAYSTYGVPDSGRRFFEVTTYARTLPRLFEHLGSRLGDEMELLHGAHEPLFALQVARLTEGLGQHRLFFLEELFAPEDIGCFRLARRQASTPLPMG